MAQISQSPRYTLKRAFSMFWFFLKLGMGLLFILWLSQVPGDVSVNTGSSEIHVQLNFALAILMLCLALTWLVMGFFKGIFSMGAFWRESRARRHRKIADMCFKNGLFAFFAEDYKLALTQLRRASKYDSKRKCIVESLQGLSALNNGQTDLAREYFEDLLKDPQGRFMGYFGLYHIEKGNEVRLLERAYEDLPENPWVLDKFRLSLCEQAEKGHSEAIQKIAKLTEKLYELRAISKQKHLEYRAEVLWLQACYERDRGENERALELAKESHDLHPLFEPPLLFLARKAPPERAQKMLLKAFASSFSATLSASITQILPKTVETFYHAEQYFEGNHRPEVLFLLAILAFQGKLWGRAKELLQRIPEDLRDQSYSHLLEKVEDADTKALISLHGGEVSFLKTA